MAPSMGTMPGYTAGAHKATKLLTVPKYRWGQRGARLLSPCSGQYLRSLQCRVRRVRLGPSTATTPAPAANADGVHMELALIGGPDRGTHPPLGQSAKLGSCPAPAMPHLR